MTLLVAAAIAFALMVSAIVVQFYWEYSDREAMRHVTLEYDVELNINGTGVVRVSLPMPVEERVFLDARIQPASSAYALNRSGNETMLDVVLSENTTFHARYYGLRSEVPVDMTETTDDPYRHINLDNCTSLVGMSILSGSVTDVLVVLSASWSEFCSGGATWQLECRAIPGRLEYRGDWIPHPVC